MNPWWGLAHDASAATLAARTLAQRRCGDTRVRNLVHELAERRDELGVEQVAEHRWILWCDPARPTLPRHSSPPFSPRPLAPDLG